MRQILSRKSLLISAAFLAVAISGLYGFRASEREPAKILWSQKEIDLTLSPGERRPLTVTFSSSSEPLNNVALSPVPEVSQFLTLQPQFFPAVIANEAQSVLITFSIPPNAVLGTYEGTIHARIGSRTLPETLKIKVTVTTPQQTLLDLADQIETGSIESALRKFTASPVNQQVLMAMDRDQRHNLATNFRNAQLATSTDTLWVFRTPWHEADGTVSQIEFSLGRTESGEWIISNW